MPLYRAMRAADPRSVRGASRTHAGRAAVARRCLPAVIRHHPGSLVFNAALCFPRPHAIPSHHRAVPLPLPPVKSIPRSRSTLCKRF
jgi:hypothetical protein